MAGKQAGATPDDHFAYLLARVHHRVQQAMDRALRTVDITPTQFYALAHISEAPGVSSAELARGLMTTPQATATLIGRLTAAGLVDHARPGRGVSGSVTLTRAGQAKLRGALATAVAAEAAALRSIPAADRKHVTSVLRSLLTELDAGS